MAKMINKLIIKYLISHQTNLQYRLNFLKDYQLILLESKESKKIQRIAAKQLRHLELLKPFAIKAGVDNDQVTLERDNKLKHLNEVYILRFRALEQSLKRALKKNNDIKTVELFDNKKIQLQKHQELAIQNLLNKYQKNNVDLDESITKYQNLLSNLNQNEKTFSEQLTSRFDNQKANIESYYAKRISHIETKINRIRVQINDLAKELDVQSELPENVLLRLSHLQMRFGGVVAVDDLSFDVKKGEIFGLIGPNGAGKTTVFNCITRFYRPTSGKMFFRKNNLEVIHLNDYPVHNIIKQGIVRTFQNVELIWELSILDNLLVAAHTLYRTSFFGQLLHLPKLKHEEEVMRKKALKILETLGLLPYQYMIPYGLPYGILKKVELARTLMANPKLIILDEPAAGLNDAETEALAKIIHKIRDEYQTTIILVEHDMGLVMDICDTVCAISFGKMLAIGTPQEIQNNPEVRSAYLGENV